LTKETKEGKGKISLEEIEYGERGRYTRGMAPETWTKEQREEAQFEKIPPKEYGKAAELEKWDTKKGEWRKIKRPLLTPPVGTIVRRKGAWEEGATRGPARQIVEREGRRIGVPVEVDIKTIKQPPPAPTEEYYVKGVIDIPPEPVKAPAGVDVGGLTVSKKEIDIPVSKGIYDVLKAAEDKAKGEEKPKSVKQIITELRNIELGKGMRYTTEPVYDLYYTPEGTKKVEAWVEETMKSDYRGDKTRLTEISEDLTRKIKEGTIKESAELEQLGKDILGTGPAGQVLGWGMAGVREYAGTIGMGITYAPAFLQQRDIPKKLGAGVVFAGTQTLKALSTDPAETAVKFAAVYGAFRLAGYWESISRGPIRYEWGESVGGGTLLEEGGPKGEWIEYKGTATWGKGRTYDIKATQAGANLQKIYIDASKVTQASTIDYTITGGTTGRLRTFTGDITTFGLAEITKPTFPIEYFTTTKIVGGGVSTSWARVPVEIDILKEATISGEPVKLHYKFMKQQSLTMNIPELKTYFDAAKIQTEWSPSKFQTYVMPSTEQSLTVSSYTVSYPPEPKLFGGLSAEYKLKTIPTTKISLPAVPKLVQPKISSILKAGISVPASQVGLVSSVLSSRVSSLSAQLQGRMSLQGLSQKRVSTLKVKQTPVSVTSLKMAQIMKVSQTSSIKQAQKQAQAQMLKIAQIQKAQQKTATAMVPVTIPPPPSLILPAFPDLKTKITKKALLGKKRKKKREYAYRPSLTAVMVGIKGKKPKGKLTGYELRPMIGKTPKMKIPKMHIPKMERFLK